MEILYNFLTMEEVLEARPGLTLYDEWQVKEAMNMSFDLLDSECNGLILNVIQFSLSKDVKDETNPFYRTTQELNYLKRAFISQTQFIINLKNDQTAGNSSLTSGGISISSSRALNFNQVAPGVYENLAKARVYKMNDVFKTGSMEQKKKLCLEKLFLTREEASEYIKYYQPEAAENSILVVNNAHLIRPMKTQDIEWKTKNADNILDVDNVYRNIRDIRDLAFFGQDGTNAMTRQQVYNAIWHSMFWNATVSYPNEAIVKVYDNNKKKVYTFKSNFDNNLGHNPLKPEDNKDNFWWEPVNVATDKIDFEEVAEIILNSKEFLDKINAINNEIQNQLNAFWEQIKDNPHLLKKFEELYDQTKTENDQLEQKLDTKINEIRDDLQQKIDDLPQSLDNVAYVNKTNNFEGNQRINGSLLDTKGFYIEGNSQTISYLKTQTAKNMYLDFEQNKALGYRNHCTLAFRHKYPNTNWNIIFKIEARSTNQGIYFFVEGGKMIFDQPTTISNVSTPIANNDVATKEYVDSSVQNANIDTTNLAKLNKRNNFMEHQGFEKPIVVGSTVSENKIKDKKDRIDTTTFFFTDVAFTNEVLISGKIAYSDIDQPIDFEGDLVHKKYLDERLDALGQTGIDWMNVNSQNGYEFTRNGTYAFRLTDSIMYLYGGNSTIEAQSNIMTISNSQQIKLDISNYYLNIQNGVEIIDKKNQQAFIASYDADIMTLKATKNLIQQNQYTPPKWERWYNGINGATAASALTISKRFVPETMLDIYCYTDDGGGNHKYINTKNYIIIGNTIRINLLDNILPKTPYQIWGREIGRRG